MRHQALKLVAPVVFALVLASCGGGTETPTNPPPTGNNSGGSNPPPGGGTTPPPGGGGFPTTAAVTVSDNQFSPPTVVIARTGTVTWTWTTGGYGVPHNVTFSDASSEDKTEGTYARTFPTAGLFTYKCLNHPAQMTGTVDVR